ncbi:MAG TPA: divergent PAP2 family protein [Candidatus Monoglobus merdigallinarum]|uniref:Divergent PAP2 family protein n=1 Tax=Candidatus Monoglobus merdigallinarum TaxID=2838698 RepID=A0A9D1PQD7_9FIRM|nr:divergent PAP2 family protein [Candidatus Monoglobus merdigallinarum]
MSYFEEFLNNRVFFVVLTAWILSCVLKGFIEMFRTKKIDWGRFFGPGGMPSSHSTIVTSLATCVGLAEGFDSSLFIMCCAFAFIVMYDASGVRRAAGEQAKIINMIVDAWEERDPVLKDEKLKEILGHTPLEVMGGAILGVVVGICGNALIGF